MEVKEDGRAGRVSGSGISQRTTTRSGERALWGRVVHVVSVSRVTGCAELSIQGVYLSAPAAEDGRYLYPETASAARSLRVSPSITTQDWT